MKKVAGNRAFTVLELLVVIAISAIIFALTLVSFIGLGRTKAVDTDAFLVRSALEQARARTLASSADTTYGLHIAETAVTFFSGDTYSASDPSNTVVNLSSYSRISEWSFAGGGQDVVFKRLTGETDHYGLLRIEAKQDPSETRTITVHATGIADVQ